MDDFCKWVGTNVHTNLGFAQGEIVDGVHVPQALCVVSAPRAWHAATRVLLLHAHLVLPLLACRLGRPDENFGGAVKDGFSGDHGYPRLVYALLK